MARHLTKQQQTRIANKRHEKIDAHSNQESNEQLLTGRVVTQYGTHVMLEDEEYNLHKATMRQNLGAIICGDYVHYIFEQESPVIVNVAPRTNVLSRLGFGKREKLLAANLDQVIIVLAPFPEPSPSLLDRYLIAINQFHIPVLFIINKCDLIKDTHQFDFIKEYSVFNYVTIYTSTKDEASLNALRAELSNKTSILVGQSGVGKSSLTNILIPELNLQTQKINAATGLGNHTTSSSTLYHLPVSGTIIDSPGVRSFDIDHLPIEAINEGFPELTPFMNRCKFSNCRHLQDPDCALTFALEEKKVSKRRIESYLQISADIARITERLY